MEINLEMVVNFILIYVALGCLTAFFTLYLMSDRGKAELSQETQKKIDLMEDMGRERIMIAVVFLWPIPAAFALAAAINFFRSKD